MIPVLTGNQATMDLYKSLLEKESPLYTMLGPNDTKLAAAIGDSLKVPYNTIYDGIPSTYPAHVTPEFVKMSLESLEADHKVWAWAFNNCLNIYVSAKSEVSQDLLDLDVWEETESAFTDIVDKVYFAKVDGNMVHINFLNKGISVFDLVDTIQYPVTNRAGFKVSPPDKKVYWTPPVEDQEPDDDALNLASWNDDDIPF